MSTTLSLLKSRRPLSGNKMEISTIRPAAINQLMIKRRASNKDIKHIISVSRSTNREAHLASLRLFHANRCTACTDTMRWLQTKCIKRRHIVGIVSERHSNIRHYTYTKCRWWNLPTTCHMTIPTTSIKTLSWRVLVKCWLIRSENIFTPNNKLT